VKRVIGATIALFVGGYFAVVAAPQQNNPAPTENSAPQEPRFSTQANEVILPVTVTDDRGRYVSNLVKDDFRVLDEGRPQRIEFFSHAEKQPIVVGFLVDLSSASRNHWDKYKEAIKELIWGLLPGDKRYTGYLISYNTQAELLVNTTDEGDRLSDKLDKVKPGGGSALYDAIYMACTRRELVKGEPFEPRRVVVIIGDGHDNASHHSLEEVLELSKRELVTIYGMSTVAFGFNSDSEDKLERFANETGGRVEYPLNTLYKDVSGYISNPRDAGNYVYDPGTGGYAAEIAKGIISAVGSIKGEVTTQYVLRYVPDIDPESADKVFRRVEVEIPSLPNVRIRTKDGYYPRPASATPPQDR
jgi:Ca-activated chloride channel homolog